MKTNHRFVIALQSTEGQSLGQFTIAPDWQPAEEAVSLAVLRGGAGQLVPDGVRMSIEPVWGGSGEPHVEGVRVAHDGHAVTVPRAYFRTLAKDLGAKLVEEKKVADGTKFTWELLAYREAAPAPVAPLPFGITVVPVTLPFREVDLSEWLGRSTPDGETGDGNFPVFIEPQVLEEARACTLAATGVETGGVLIGHLLRDHATREIGLWITAQIPAQHAPATSAKLSFTPDTWVGVRAAIALRRRDELMIGTWHSHPAIAWCAKCPPERQRECGFRTPFFSDDDVLLHRTAFFRAYCVGLVIAHAADGLRHGLFGWQAGLIEPRSFHITEPNHDHAPSLTPTT
ncbi:MAG: Mov34/MPN/PAD-1 family protein [Chthoniobacteraceae bacterium]